MTLRFAASTLVALFAATAAFAQEGTRDFVNQTPSTRSRDDVRSELARARAAGQLENRGQTYGSFAPSEFVSSRMRAQVIAEFDAARRAGELDARNESYGSLARRDAVSTKTRAEVRAELEQAQAAGVHLSRGNRSGR